MTDRRNDAGLAVPMVDDMVRRYGKATGEPSGRHPLRHQRGYRRPGRACGRPGEGLCAAAERARRCQTCNARQAGEAAGAGTRKREGVAQLGWQRKPARTCFSLRKLIERINANLKNHGFGFIAVRGLMGRGTARMRGGRGAGLNDLSAATTKRRVRGPLHRANARSPSPASRGRYNSIRPAAHSRASVVKQRCIFLVTTGLDPVVYAEVRRRRPSGTSEPASSPHGLPDQVRQ